VAIKLKFLLGQKRSHKFNKRWGIIRNCGRQQVACLLATFASLLHLVVLTKEVCGTRIASCFPWRSTLKFEFYAKFVDFQSSDQYKQNIFDRIGLPFYSLCFKRSIVQKEYWLRYQGIHLCLFYYLSAYAVSIDLMFSCGWNRYDHL
jgi:hypothetical protein